MVQGLALPCWKYNMALQKQINLQGYQIGQAWLYANPFNFWGPKLEHHIPAYPGMILFCLIAEYHGTLESLLKSPVCDCELPGILQLLLLVLSASIKKNSVA